MTSDVSKPDEAGTFDDGDAMFALPGFEAPPLPRSAASPAAPYRVLARKYRPQTFDDLIGQEAMVRTLSNAFTSGRIPQAWMLTGVRGIGKTTTARILARALNYALPDDSDAGPTVHMTTLGIHCQAIIESRHVDVLEMDAASHTGIDDVKQITDGVRYAPASARYKVYIIDEVHMLSEKAFNAFLKTLEEPPSHAKFVFATTEIRKVPITILSRCQRFDLRRIDAGAMIAHLAGICAKESVRVEPDALPIIVRAAEGSVRDALSLLDQAISNGDGHVEPVALREMLGLADRARVIDLFEALMRGEIADALNGLASLWEAGGDPVVILIDLAAFTHFVTRLKIAPVGVDDVTITPAERERGGVLAQALPMRVLSRTWQMLTKGIAEVQVAPKPYESAQMVLVRLAYAADLPTPDEALRSLRDEPVTASISDMIAPAASMTGGASATAVGPSVSTARVPVSALVPSRSTGHSTASAGLTSGSTAGLPAPEPRGDARRVSGGSPVADPARTEPDAIIPIDPVEISSVFPVFETFDDLVAYAARENEMLFKIALEKTVRLVRFAPGIVEFSLVEGASNGLVATMRDRLETWTGRRWLVALTSAQGQPTIADRKQNILKNQYDDVRSDPLVAAILKRFPGAEIMGVHDNVPYVGPGALVDIEEAEARTHALAAIPDDPAQDISEDPSMDPDDPRFSDDGDTD